MKRLHDPDPGVGAATAEQLGELGDRKAVGPLVQALRSPHSVVRGRASEALGRIGDPRGIPPLCSLLRDENESVRAEAFSALFAIGQSRASELPVGAFLGEDLGNPSDQLTQLVWSTDLEAVGMLVEGLDDPDPEVRIGALYTLGRMGVASALSKINRILMQDPDDDVRAAAAFSLGDLAEQVRDPQIMRTLTQAWKTVGGRAEVAVLLMRAIADSPDISAYHAMAEGLLHPDPRVRQLAAMGLGRLAEPGAITPLAAALLDEHQSVKRCAAEALGRIEHAAAIPPLIAAMVDSDAEVRATIGRALSHHDKAVVHASIERALSDADPKLRRAAAYLMGRTRDQDGLVRAVEDQDDVVRREAVLAMGHCGLRRFGPILELKLDDPAWKVRASAAEALRRIGDVAAIEALRAHADDSHKVVRSAVGHAIAALAGR